MTYCAVLELFGALEHGRLDSDMFHKSCSQLWSHLNSIPSNKVTWYIDVYHVYAETEDEASLFRWVSMLCEKGVLKASTSNTPPWILKGVVLDGKLGVESSGKGLITSSSPGIYSELRTYLNNFHSVGVRVGYVPKSDIARGLIFSNVLWTGHKDIPYAMFTDIKPSLLENLTLTRISELTMLATKTAHFSKSAARCYLSAITRILINAKNYDINEAIAILSRAKTVDGIELTGLVLINRVFEDTNYDAGVSDLMVAFPRLSNLCMFLQEKHAFPVGVVDKAPIKRYLNALQGR